jgi:hypothetical protein
VPQAHGCNGIIAGAAHERECDQRAVPALKIGAGRHEGHGLPNLRDAGDLLLAVAFGNARVLPRGIEVLRIRVFDA